MARKATWGRYVKKKRMKYMKDERRTMGRRRALKRGHRNRLDAK
jgi:hypothetical protein